LEEKENVQFKKLVVIKNQLLAHHNHKHLKNVKLQKLEVVKEQNVVISEEFVTKNSVEKLNYSAMLQDMLVLDQIFQLLLNVIKKVLVVIMLQVVANSIKFVFKVNVT